MSVTGFQRRRRMIAAMRAQAEAELRAKAEPAKNAEPTKKDIMAKLDDLGIDYDKRSNKDALMALLEAAQNGIERDHDDPEDNHEISDDNQDNPEDDEGAE